MVASKVFTADDLLTMSGDYEPIRGELREVSPSFAGPSRVAAIITGEVTQLNVGHGLGEVFTSDGGFVLSRHPLVSVAPDVAFVRAENIPSDYDVRAFFPGAPDLAVEALSPSDRPGAVEETTVERYLAYGSKLVWKADPIPRLVEVWRPDRPPAANLLHRRGPLRRRGTPWLQSARRAHLSRAAACTSGRVTARNG